MLHACLCTICFVFCYTSWHFYAFSRTNLLTRCHGVSSLFSAVFVFQKSYTGNILGIGQNEAKHPIFLGRKMKTEGEPEGAQGPTTPGGGAPPPPGRARGWCGAPGRPLTPPLRLYKAFRLRNPKLIGVFPRKVLQRRRRRRPISGDRSLCSGTLPRWGSAPGAISIDSIASTAVFIDFTAIFIDVDVSYDEEGVVLPRGWGLYR
jgi:hypothetical protein